MSHSIFEPEMQSLLGNNSRKADIVFFSSGRIDISARIVKSLNLSCGDVLDIMMDGCEYYLYVKHRAPFGRYEAMVFPSNKRGHHFRTNSIRLSTAIIRASGADGTAKLCVGSPVFSGIYGTMLPIIIKLLL